MKNTKKLLVGVLSVAALLGTGVAAWTVGGGFANDSKDVKPTVETEVYTRNLALDVKAVDETIKFDSKADLKVSYKVKAIKGDRAAPDFEPYNLDNYKMVAEEYEPDLTVSVKAVDATTKEVLKESDPFFTYVKLPKAKEIHYEDWLAANYKDEGYPVDIELEWAEKYGNPQDYIDVNPEAWDQGEQETWINSVIADLEGVNFQFLFQVKGIEGEDVPPVEEVTGTVTLPERVGSKFDIEGYDPEKGTVTAGKHLITITTDEGKVVKDNKLTIYEGETPVDVTLNESPLTRAVGNTYTWEHEFKAGVAYRFDYTVVDETPDEPDPTEKFAVTFSATGGGSIDVKVGDTSIESGDEVEEGKEIVVTVTANEAEGYKLTLLTVNGKEQALENTTLTLKVDKALYIEATFEKEDAPSELVVFEEGKLGLWQSTLEQSYYFSGSKESYYFTTTTSFEEAVNITSFKTVDNTYYLQIMDENNSKKYISTVVDGEYKNLAISDVPYAWTYDETYKTYFANIDGANYFIGNYGGDTFISLYSTDFIDNPGENIARIVKEEIKNPNPDTGLVSSFTWASGDGTLTDGVLSFTIDNKFTVEHSKGANKSNPVTNEYAQWRIYKDHDVTISSDTYLIEKITFTDTNDKTDFSINAISNNFTATLAEGTRNWTLTANDGGVSSLTFRPGQQIRIVTMKIYYIAQ